MTVAARFSTLATVAGLVSIALLQSETQLPLCKWSRRTKRVDFGVPGKQG